MANRAMLLSISSKGGEQDGCADILAAASYAVPLFWLTMCSPEDMVLEEIEMDDETFGLMSMLVLKSKRERQHEKLFIQTSRKESFPHYAVMAGQKTC